VEESRGEKSLETKTISSRNNKWKRLVKCVEQKEYPEERCG